MGNKTRLTFNSSGLSNEDEQQRESKLPRHCGPRIPKSVSVEQLNPAGWGGEARQRPLAQVEPIAWSPVAVGFVCIGDGFIEGLRAPAERTGDEGGAAPLRAAGSNGDEVKRE